MLIFQISKRMIPPAGIFAAGRRDPELCYLRRFYSFLPRCENQFLSSSLFCETVSLNSSVLSARIFSRASFAICFSISRACSTSAATSAASNLVMDTSKLFSFAVRAVSYSSCAKRMIAQPGCRSGCLSRCRRHSLLH